MELRDIRYIIAVANSNSISQAARSLFISQPALSQQLRRIEKQLGVSIFRHDRNRLFLTNAGSIIVQEGRKLLHDYDHMMAQVSLNATSSQEVLRFGISPFYSKYYLPDVLRYYANHITDVRLEIVEKISVELENDVAKGLLNLCFVPQFPTHTQLEYEMVAMEEIMLAAPLNHPLKVCAKQLPDLGRSIDLREARGESFILQPPQQKISAMQDSIFQHSGFAPKIIYKTNNWDTVRILTSNGLGLSLLPELFNYVSLNDAPVDMYHIEGINTTRPYAAAFRHGAVCTKQEERLIQVFRQVIEGIRTKSPVP